MEIQPSMARYLRPEEAAEIAGCGRSYIYLKMQSGELKSVKIGRLRRIPQEALREWLDGLAQQGE